MRRNHWKEETAKTKIAASPAASNNSLREADSGREGGQAGVESVTHMAQGKPEGRKEWKELSAGWHGRGGGWGTCEFVVILSLQVLLPCLSPAELQRACPTWKVFCEILQSWLPRCGRAIVLVIQLVPVIAKKTAAEI